ncbi:MAG: autotransporter domain-containing protein [Methylophilaceae bacterium]|nr:MAG: autotransporter domain-containing protein [Methylophilaceae bacterium]
MLSRTFSFKFIKIGHVVISAAFFALAAFSSSLSAATYELGTTIAGSDSSGSTIYNSNVQSYNYGSLLGAPSTLIINIYGNTTNFTGSIRQFNYTPNTFAALGVSGGEFTGSDSFVLGSGVVVDSVTLGSAASGQYSAIFDGIGYEWTGSIGSSSTVTSYAVETSGSLALNGGNYINGDTRADSGVNVLGSGNFMNGDVDANITFNNAGSLTVAGGGDVTGNINFGGYNGLLTLSDGSDVAGSIDTSSSRTGSVVFENNSIVTGSIGSTSAIEEVSANGTGVVQINGLTNATEVNLYAAGTVAFGGGLDTRFSDSDNGLVNFRNYNGTVQIGNDSSLYGDVINSANNLGTLTFVSGAQSMNGQIGTDSNKINTLNIGGANTGLGFDVSTDVYSTTTVNGDVFATSTVLNNSSVASSELILATGKNITGTSVTTADANKGILTLQGGDQTVTASVGASGAWLNTVNSGADSANSTITGDVYSVNVTNTGSGTSNFNGNVTATNINVDAGTSYFNQSVNATTTRIGTGTGHFNTVGGTTSSTNLNFTGNGTANLNQGMTFTNIDYAGNDATVNVAADKNLVGTAISTTTDGTGYLNMLGGTQTVDATVGAASLGLNKITAGADGATTNFTNTAAVYANTLEVTGNGLVNLSGGLVGNLDYVNNVSSENGTVTIASGKNLIGNVTTGASGYSQGVLTMIGGEQQVSGTIGSDGAPLTTVNAGATGSTTTLNGMTYADTLQFTGNGTVVLNGTNSANPVAGLKGTVDFGTNAITDTGTLEVGDGVNLTTGATGINFKDANNATLTFNGSSTVTGNIGSAGNDDNNVFKTINAGVTGKFVTFLGDVYVSASTFHVTGDGVVNLGGDLYGPLTFDSPSEGSVNIANNKSIIVSSGPQVTSYGTSSAGKGTVNFVGGTTLSGDVGTSSAYILAANFHNTTSDTTNSPLYVGSVTQTLNKNIYATTTTIGNDLGYATVGDVTANVFLGNALTLSAGTTVSTSTTTLNTAGSVDALSGSVVFNHSKNADGTLTNVATVTQSTFGESVFTTNGGTLNFAVASEAYNNSFGGGQLSSDVTQSSKVSGGTGSTLAMNGNEKVNISLLGSLRNNVSYTLIDVASGDTNANQAATLIDNSYVIDTILSRSNGDLVLTTSRDENTYVNKSNTLGHFSNNAATTLAGLGALGTGYSSDMQVVFNQLDLDQWGYGNNQANLANEVKRLAPISNGSLTRSAVAANTLALDVANSRMAGLRGDIVLANSLTGISSGNAQPDSAFWMRALGSTAKQDQRKSYDGYRTNTYGAAFGLDHNVTDDLILGFGLAAVTARVDQHDFRSADDARINNYSGMIYGSYNLSNEAYVEGVINYTENKYRGDRATAVGRNARYDFDGNQYGGRLGAGYKISLGNNTTFIPMASIEYSRLEQDAYTEKDAGAIGLNVDSQSYSRTRYGLGGRLTTKLGTEIIYRPEIDLGWYRDTGTLNKDVVASYIGGGEKFVTPGTDYIGRNFVNLGLGLNVEASQLTTIQVRYDLDASNGFESHTGSIAARINF